ncbi:hypothetical protein PF007_g18652 [Phytophthora fragariae]|nr:hypothetical protein PF009_g19615 [Phytophthora fragariae]KAE9092089.1 hypothetical protein PF007_g18652 [Phytophthora fragariae]KAE9099304.1 hypothetical protein PF006_g23165 [Phytophthora fragariae]
MWMQAGGGHAVLVVNNEHGAAKSGCHSSGVDVDASMRGPNGSCAVFLFLQGHEPHESTEEGPTSWL